MLNAIVKFGLLSEQEAKEALQAAENKDLRLSYCNN